MKHLGHTERNSTQSKYHPFRLRTSSILAAIDKNRSESTITSSLSVYAKVLVDNLNGIKISAFLID